jgi:glutathione synthase/RimK-type ligase-like ATP-grasp enzyme
MHDTDLNRRRVAFLTMEETAGWSIDADLAFGPLAELGWQAEWLPWRSADVTWDDWDAVYLAATWDYPDDPQAFLRVLEAIDTSRAVLVNDIEIVRWNIPKTYLRDLEAGGAPIVPSRWYGSFAECDLGADFAAFGADRLIVKPVVSTNARDTFLLDRAAAAQAGESLARIFASRAFVVQPFIGAVQTEGEYSLFYIGDRFSHGIRKVPKAADFRVQEEHGATIESAALTPELLSAGERAVSLVCPEPLYARCDLVRDSDGVLRIMELELIEPSLYLRMHESAAKRFAVAFDRYVKERGREK